MQLVPRIVKAAPAADLWDFSTYPDGTDLGGWTPTGYVWDILGGVLRAEGGYWHSGSIGVVSCWLDGYGHEEWTMDAHVAEMLTPADGLPRINYGAVSPEDPDVPLFAYLIDWASSTSVVQELRVNGVTVAQSALDAAVVKSWVGGPPLRYRISNEGGMIRAWTPAPWADPIAAPAFEYAADIPTNRPALRLHGWQRERYAAVELSRDVGGAVKGGILRTIGRG